MEKEIGLYIHIPFCKQKCYYCDFLSFSGCEQTEERYVNALKKELIQYATENKIMAKHNLESEILISTIYIGGGTPSYINEKYISEILKTVRENFKIKENAEITIEVNPGTVNKNKLQTYKESGVNRLSIGLQATQDELLRKIGRIHTYQDFLETYNMAREEVGFQNINIDLMINLPDQTIENVKESLKRIIELNPEHISVYSLIVEEGTPMEQMIKKGETKLASDDEERKMYWKVKNVLEKHKYIQYEISNFAKPGFKSQHNWDCWSQKEYIGIGLGASSFLEDTRYSNEKNLEKYIKNLEEKMPNKNLILEEKLNFNSKMNEYMLLSLRKIEGVNIQEFKRKFVMSPIIKYSKTLEKLSTEGLIQIDDTNIKLTNKGIDLANLVWEEFV